MGDREGVDVYCILVNYGSINFLSWFIDSGIFGVLVLVWWDVFLSSFLFSYLG